jgi:glycosyltransferase involved in cell wall biosynthesis
MDLKVCVLPYRVSSSGIATYTLELSRALASAGIKVYLATLGLQKSQKLDLEKFNIEIIEVDTRDPIEYGFLGGPLPEYMLISSRLKKILESKEILNNVDLLHFTLPPACHLFNYQDVSVVTAWVPLNFKDDMKKNFRSFKFPWNILAGLATIQGQIGDNVALRKARRIVCVTKDVFRRINHNYPNKAVYIPPFIRKPEISPTKKEKDVPSVLCIARNLELPRKNVVTFLEAVALLGRKGKRNFSVVLVGKYADSINALAKRISVQAKIDVKLIQFTTRDKLTEVYGSSDIFVCPSFYEEFGYTLLEAMAHKLPIIASNISIFREISKGGRNGFLVPVNNPSALASALERLIEDRRLRQRLGEESLRIIQEEYDWRTISQNLVNLYMSILKD